MSASTEPTYISTDDALAAARAAAFNQWSDDSTCGHNGCTDHPAPPRKRIHTISRSGFGADWDLKEAEEFIATSQRCAWVPNFMGHELGVVGADGRAIQFEVQRPAGDAA